MIFGRTYILFSTVSVFLCGAQHFRTSISTFSDEDLSFSNPRSYMMHGGNTEFIRKRSMRYNNEDLNFSNPRSYMIHGGNTEFMRERSNRYNPMRPRSKRHNQMRPRPILSHKRRRPGPILNSPFDSATSHSRINFPSRAPDPRFKRVIKNNYPKARTPPPTIIYVKTANISIDPINEFSRQIVDRPNLANNKRKRHVNNNLLHLKENYLDSANFFDLEHSNSKFFLENHNTNLQSERHRGQPDEDENFRETPFRGDIVGIDEDENYVDANQFTFDSYDGLNDKEPANYLGKTPVYFPRSKHITDLYIEERIAAFFKRQQFKEDLLKIRASYDLESRENSFKNNLKDQSITEVHPRTDESRLLPGTKFNSASMSESIGTKTLTGLSQKIKREPVRSSVEFITPSTVKQLNAEFDTSLMNLETSCDLKDGHVNHNGKCRLLLAKSGCPVNRWLLLSHDGTPSCHVRKCPWGSLYHEGQCIDPSDESVCGPGQILYVNLSGETECDCMPNYSYHDITDTCFVEHEQGFCNNGFFVERDDRNKLKCVRNPCSVNRYLSFKNKCYRKVYEGGCPPDQMNYLKATKTVECSRKSSSSVFGVGIQTSCASGSKRSYFERCNAVFRLATHRTFPRQRGKCPRKHIGRAKTCLKVVKLFGN